MPGPLFVDTDPGVDDALAIFMAHAHTEICGLGIVDGNVGLQHSVANALKLTEVLNVTTPVYPGSRQPLVCPAADASRIHGRDGFGDTGYRPAVCRAQDEHAALALLRISKERAGELVVVALGPLTNLALALSIDPELPQRISRLILMGGAVHGCGNTSPGTEFNIGFDPEAARIVFERWPQFELVDWELCVRQAWSFERFEAWLAADDYRARFYSVISRQHRTYSRTQGRQGVVVADALAMAVALQPQIVTQTEARYVSIELDGELTRGMTVVDWQQRTGQAANAHIVMNVDTERFSSLVASALGACRAPSPS